MSKKPIFFEAATIFSMAGSAIGFSGMFLAALFFKPVVEKIKLLTNLTATDNLSPLYFAMIGAAFAISFAGSVKLFRLQISGLYFYLAAQLLIIILPVLQLGSDAFSATNLIFTLLFSGVFLYHYKLLKY